MHASGSQQRRDHGVPSPHQWLLLQPKIEELYLDQDYKIEEVTEYLRQCGYTRMTERMVRVRITQWNLQKNNRLQDMEAALRLLDPDPARWDSPNPRFRIRRREVDLTEILRFFRRKRIPRPFEHAWSAESIRRGMEDRNVAVLDSEAASSPSTSDNSTALSDFMSGQFTHHSSIGSSPDSRLHDQTVSSNLTRRLPRRTRNPQQESSTRHSLPMQVSVVEQRAVASFRDYCSAYVVVYHADAHRAPSAHRDTPYQRFADRMTNAVAMFKRQDHDAVRVLGTGYDLVRPLLLTCHPMALARLLSVVCHLAAQGDDYIPLLINILNFIAAMAQELGFTGPITELLSSLSLTAPHLLLQTAVQSLQAAVGVLSQYFANTWHGLYLQARLCDCLYYSKSPSETVAYRLRLLLALESFHGPLARTVIWTMTQVGHDYLNARDIDSGEQYYSMARVRAEQLGDGFGRAEMRFAALQGLARAEKMRFEYLSCNASSDASAQAVAISSLNSARVHLDEALGEANVWFDRNSHRVVRAEEEREHIERLLDSLGTSSESSSQGDTPSGSSSLSV